MFLTIQTNSILKLQERFKLPVFHGLKIAFENFDEPEKLKMIGLAEDNGGAAVQLNDPTVTHIVSSLKFDLTAYTFLLPCIKYTSSIKHFCFITRSFTKLQFLTNYASIGSFRELLVFWEQLSCVIRHWDALCLSINN